MTQDLEKRSPKDYPVARQVFEERLGLYPSDRCAAIGLARLGELERQLPTPDWKARWASGWESFVESTLDPLWKVVAPAVAALVLLLVLARFLTPLFVQPDTLEPRRRRWLIYAAGLLALSGASITPMLLTLEPGVRTSDPNDDKTWYKLLVGESSWDHILSATEILTLLVAVLAAAGLVCNPRGMRATWGSLPVLLSTVLGVGTAGTSLVTLLGSGGSQLTLWLWAVGMAIAGIGWIAFARGTRLALEVSALRDSTANADLSRLLLTRLGQLGSEPPRGIRVPQQSDVNTLPEDALTAVPEGAIASTFFKIVRLVRPSTPWKVEVALSGQDRVTWSLRRNGKVVGIDHSIVTRDSVQLGDPTPAENEEKKKTSLLDDDRFMTAAAAALLIELSRVHLHLQRGLCGAKTWRGVALHALACQLPQGPQRVPLLAGALEADPEYGLAKLSFLYSNPTTAPTGADEDTRMRFRNRLLQLERSASSPRRGLRDEAADRFPKPEERKEAVAAARSAAEQAARQAEQAAKDTADNAKETADKARETADKAKQAAEKARETAATAEAAKTKVARWREAKAAEAAEAAAAAARTAEVEADRAALEVKSADRHKDSAAKAVDEVATAKQAAIDAGVQAARERFDASDQARPGIEDIGLTAVKLDAIALAEKTVSDALRNALGPAAASSAAPRGAAEATLPEEFPAKLVDKLKKPAPSWSRSRQGWEALHLRVLCGIAANGTNAMLAANKSPASIDSHWLVSTDCVLQLAWHLREHSGSAALRGLRSDQQIPTAHLMKELQRIATPELKTTTLFKRLHKQLKDSPDDLTPTKRRDFYARAAYLAEDQTHAADMLQDLETVVTDRTLADSILDDPSFKQWFEPVTAEPTPPQLAQFKRLVGRGGPASFHDLQPFAPRKDALRENGFNELGDLRGVFAGSLAGTMKIPHLQAVRWLKIADLFIDEIHEEDGDLSTELQILEIILATGVDSPTTLRRHVADNAKKEAFYTTLVKEAKKTRLVPTREQTVAKWYKAKRTP